VVVLGSVGCVGSVGVGVPASGVVVSACGVGCGVPVWQLQLSHSVPEGAHVWNSMLPSTHAQERVIPGEQILPHWQLLNTTPMMANTPTTINRMVNQRYLSLICLLPLRVASILL
jgi:hypothetical protein